MLRNPGQDPVDVNQHWRSWHRPWRKGWPWDQVSIPEVNIWESCEQNETVEITDLVIQLYFWQAQILLWFQTSIRGWGSSFPSFFIMVDVLIFQSKNVHKNWFRVISQDLRHHFWWKSRALWILCHDMFMYIYMHENHY